MPGAGPPGPGSVAFAMASPRPFRIRHYECDAYGHLNNTAYLRYLEEVELAAGRTGAELRAVDLTYVQPLRFGDTVDVAAAAGDAPGERRYRYLHAGVEVAHATGWWAQPGGAIEPPPPPPARVYRQERRVGWRDVDDSGAAGPATLAAFAEDCGVDLCAEFGWPLQRCSAEGFAMVLRRHQIDYGRPLRLGDRYTITTYASDRARVSATRHYLVDHDGGERAARFRSHYVWVDPATMRPIRIPAGFLADFAENFSGQ